MNPQFFQKPVKHNGRNGFDLSSNHVFDMRPSVLRPVIIQDTVPNSSYRINCLDLVRTGALQRAAFLRGRQELDFFFVPYSQVFTGANEIIFGRADPHSVRQPLDDTEIPKFNLGNLVYLAGIPYVFTRLVADVKAFNPTFFYSYQNLKLNTLFNLMLEGTRPDSVIVRIARQLFYNAYSATQELREMVHIGADCLHMLSTAGYGDYLNLCDSVFIQEENNIRSFFQGSPAEISSGFPDFFAGILYEWEAKVTTNVSYFEVGTPITSAPTEDEPVRMVTLLRLCAYQKIFKDYYRDSINDDSNLYLYASSCDFSSLSTFYRNPFDAASGYSDNQFFLLTVLKPRLSQFAKDISTGCYASAQFGSFARLSEVNSIDDIKESVDPAAATNYSSGNALAIRFTLALQRYRETLLRAGNRTKDLLMSEFGVQSNYIADTYVKHIGSFGGNLELNKVEATAETGTYSVGDLAGNIFSSLQGDTIDFTCNDHGFIIGVMRFVCNPLHNAFGVNPFLYKSRQFDFYHEEFENLGLQPVSSDYFTTSVPANDTISPVTIGFSARYNEYKQNLDFVHDSFTTKFPLFNGLANGEQVDGINSNYVTVRDTIQSVSNIRERSYMLPNIMDSIFREVDTGLSESYHFQVTLSCSISAVLPMSVMGLPTN